MTDSYGDGWNGGFLTIRANGTPVPGSPFSVSAAQAFSATATITIPAGQTLQLTYTSGTWENENAYTLIQNGTTIFSAGPTPGTGIVFTTTCSPAYTYAWSNSAITQDIASLAAGVYNVTITDPTGCTFTGGPYTVTAPAAPTATATPTNVACNGAATGSVTLTASGGTAAYSFLWNNGRTTQNNTGLAAGTYTVTVTDANGCTSTSSATITEPTALTSSTVTVTDATCSTAGAVDINVSGGTSGYTFNWSNGATSEDLSGLSAGAFSVTITDANGCSVTNGPNTVAAIGTPTASLVTSSDVSCTGNNDGTIDISVSGGTPAYTFLWSNAATTEDLSGLSAGTYNVTVSDNLGCIATITTIVISEPTAISVTNTSNNVSCNAAANGAISLTVAGGSPNYSFLWSNGSTNEDLTGLNGGNYTVTVTDANGCVRTVGPVNIAEPTAIAVSNINPSDASCGNNDGAIAISVGGGTGAYTFQWSNGATTEDISGLAGGDYDVIITDANGCSIVSNDIPVGSGSNITITLSSVDEACGQPNSGAVALAINGGTAPYSFVWNNAATTQNLSAIAAGTYSVTVTDADACTTSGAATVAPAFQPTLNAGVLPTMATDTTITWGDVSNITGGNDQTAQGVTYTWTATGPANANVNFGNANAHQTSIEPSADGNYTLVLTATSLDGCVTTDTIRISVIANNPQIPTAFSPNGDNSNPTFQVVGLDKSLLTEFKVYNRWGQIVYDDATEGQWDGTFKGADQPRDVYIYVISWTSGAETVVKRGTVTLLR
jgi:gliding motility-associated-like protein